MADWIDTDLNPAGAVPRTAVYSSETPPYRPPNRVITSPTELLALKGFGPERYAKIAPYVTALPRGTPINLCTASERCSMRCRTSSSGSGAGRPRSATAAASAFPDKADVRGDGDRADQDLERWTKALGWGEVSDHFLLRTVATIGTSEFALYSLLHHEGAAAGAPRARVVTRAVSRNDPWLRSC